MATWKRLACNFKELNLDKTLVCGQSFRWRQNGKGEWISVLSNLVWSLKQDPETGDILYLVHGPEVNNEPSPNSQTSENKTIKRNTRKKNRYNPIKKEPEALAITNHLEIKGSNSQCHETILRDYFQLDICVADLYKEWCEADDHFKDVANKFPGIRILRQNPIENLFAFICSSNNHISRISGMVEKLCTNYGQYLMEVDGEKYYSFPTVQALSVEGVEPKLRELGFGYRAKYIAKTAKELANNHPSNYLETLREVPFEEAHNHLIKLHGIGAKVADCICLMSLDKTNAIPVDTHVWQIAARDYLPHLRGKKTVTASMYKEIGDFFREKFGKYAGWAHSVLFCSDLKKFQKT